MSGVSYMIGDTFLSGPSRLCECIAGHRGASHDCEFGPTELPNDSGHRSEPEIGREDLTRIRKRNRNTPGGSVAAVAVKGEGSSAGSHYYPVDGAGYLDESLA